MGGILSLLGCDGKNRKSKPEARTSTSNRDSKTASYQRIPSPRGEPSGGSRGRASSVSLEIPRGGKVVSPKPSSTPPGTEMQSVVGSPSIDLARKHRATQSMRKLPSAGSPPTAAKAAKTLSMREFPRLGQSPPSIQMTEFTFELASSSKNEPSDDEADSNSSDENTPLLQDSSSHSKEKRVLYEPADYPMDANKWLLLPDELWLQIAKCLPLTKVQDLQKVCRHFETIFADPQLHSQLVESQYQHKIIVRDLPARLGYRVVNYFEQRLQRLNVENNIGQEIINFNKVALEYWTRLAEANVVINRLVSMLKEDKRCPKAILNRFSKVKLTSPEVIELFLLHYYPDAELINRLKKEKLLPDYTNPKSRLHFETHGSDLFPFSHNQNFIDWLKTVLTLKNIKHPAVEAIFPLLLDCMTKHFTALFKAEQLWAAIPMIAINLLITDKRDFAQALSWLSKIHVYCVQLTRDESSPAVLELLLLEIGRFYPGPTDRADNLCNIAPRFSVISGIEESAVLVTGMMSQTWDGRSPRPQSSEVREVLQSYQPTFHKLRKKFPTENPKSHIVDFGSTSMPPVTAYG
jgi:hypothetical protein